MTISLKTWNCYAGDDQINLSVSDKEYFRAKTHRAAFNAVMSEFAKLQGDNGLSRSNLAKRLGVDRSQITRWLSSPSNMTLDSLSDLLLGMRCMVKITAESLSEQEQGDYTQPMRRPVTNQAAKSLENTTVADVHYDVTDRPLNLAKTSTTYQEAA